MRILGDEIDGVRDRTQKMKHSLRFITSILYKYPNLRGASTIKGRIQNRMNNWNEEKVSAVSFSAVKDT